MLDERGGVDGIWHFHGHEKSLSPLPASQKTPFLFFTLRNKLRFLVDYLKKYENDILKASGGNN